MKTGNVVQTGACGDVVASHNHYGSYHRKRPSRKKRRNKRRTPETDRAEANWRAISALWNNLSEAQYRAWEIATEGERSRPRAGRSSRLPSRNLFFKINNSRASLSLTLLADPPVPADAGPNPVGQLHVTNRGDRVVFRLEVSGAAHDPIKVYGAAPQNRGTKHGRDFRVLCSLPPSRNGEVDITEWYVQKFGVPEPGKRVFIRTVVEVNGRQSDPQETNCVVPERPPPASTRKGRPAIWADEDV